ncbi:MAG: hypothetical protein Kow0077_15000 [Anaerolineae bacterium]
MKHNRVILNPQDPDEALTILAFAYDLDDDTLEALRRIIMLFPRPVTLYVDESSALFYGQTPLVDKFTFNMQTDELVLFASDSMTFIDATIEMVMYLTGFATMIGVDDGWKIELAIGAWKPVKNRLKRELGIPTVDEPLWVVGLPPEDGAASPEDPQPFQILVSRLDIVSFEQMIRLAARDDVEVSFPIGADQRVIQVYLDARETIARVGEGITLQDWREFNRRLLEAVQALEEKYQPRALPVPHWWNRHQDASGSPEAESSSRFVEAPINWSQLNPEAPITEQLDTDDGADSPERQQSDPDESNWDPFAAFIDTLLDDDPS